MGSRQLERYGRPVTEEPPVRPWCHLFRENLVTCPVYDKGTIRGVDINSYDYGGSFPRSFLNHSSKYPSGVDRILCLL